jgi:hypothetical protein
MRKVVVLPAPFCLKVHRNSPSEFGDGADTVLPGFQIVYSD